MVTHSRRTITPLELPAGGDVSLSIHEYEGSEGPTVYVQAAQHGREVNGTEVLRRLHDELVEADIAGRVIAVPVADPLTFDHASYTASRGIDETNPNMNRVWPGDSEGSAHGRIAAALWEHASAADAVVDLHTMSPDALSHVVVTEGDRESIALAEAFGTDLTLVEPLPGDSEGDEDTDEEWHRRNFSGKLRVTAARRGIPCITPELGSHTRVQESAVETGLVGLRNALRHLGVLPGDPVGNGRTERARNHLGRVRADESGLFVPGEVAVGDRVTEGDRLGTLYGPTDYGVRQEVRADREGVLYALTREATVVAGDTLANVALPLE
ncbi:MULTISPECIES: succinylglutamate desuccinylase/aspartoacylase family protein [Saliphagus]|uniref:Succinylglutamate desuccinylase/aspartoacylase family protein n=1 Tax=Saliphagus infecundisoli TaxID=1849069 RepID=A0ABD5Q9L5_9EURY|nr:MULTISPECIES: succinylglutamate desuccinylase/aspartoacylase family protein [Saliphagus]